MAKNKIAAIINVYEDAEFVERTLRSIEDIADKIIVADGAYKKYPYGNSAISMDGTRNIVQEYADLFFSCGINQPWESEEHKRNTLLAAVPQGWYALRIDADEEIEKFDESILERKEDVFLCTIKEYTSPDNVRRERSISAVFKPGHDWFYKQNDALFKGSKSITNLKRVQTDQIVFGHHPYARNDERLDERAEYRRRNQQHFHEPRDE